jgi:hypothetical protein
MAKNMPAPWISQTFLNLMKENVSDTSKSGAPLRRPKVVQVLKVYEKMGILIVNDKKNSVAVMLSKRCLSDYKDMYNSQPLSTLAKSMVKLENWHFSTIIQSAGPDRELRAIATQSGITLPIAISCSRITSLGAFDCVTIGEPVDLNTVCVFSVDHLRLTSYLTGSRYTHVPERNELYFPGR